MTNIEEIRQEILELKQQKNAVILAHLYQDLEVQGIADYTGDSLKLARDGKDNNADIIIFCGVDFMAESAKILAPHKKVILPEPNSMCPMAKMADAKNLQLLKDKHPDAVVITYINSSAEVKAISDCCCTSANAINIVKHYAEEGKQIIFTPDRNLGNYCAVQNGLSSVIWDGENYIDEEDNKSKSTDAQVILWNGFCHVHDEISVSDIFISKQEHNNSLLLVHPEARPEILEIANFVGSTSQIIKFVEDNVNLLDKDSSIIIGTEIEISRLLKKRYPDKNIFQLADHAICKNMKKNTLPKILKALREEEPAIELDDEIIQGSVKALNKMLELS